MRILTKPPGFVLKLVIILKRYRGEAPHPSKEIIMLKSIFDAFPSLVFVVDHDVRIQEYNAAAADFLMSERETILQQRAGEIFNCIHSTEVNEGCGRAPDCRTCVIRNSVMSACDGMHVVRRRTKMVLIQETNPMEIYVLITATPFAFQEKPFVLLVIEDISEIIELYRMIPICSVCKKIRDDGQSWVRIETYFKNNWDCDFTHSLCPDCYRIEIDKLNSFADTEEE